MVNTLIYIVLFLLLAGGGAAGFFFLREHLSGGGLGSSLFGPRPERRLDVVEQASVDARRRLILIRRDDVEHLIMTGGPVDVVIETGIGGRQSADHAEPPVYNRPARTLAGVAQARAVNGGKGD